MGKKLKKKILFKPRKKKKELFSGSTKLDHADIIVNSSPEKIDYKKQDNVGTLLEKDLDEKRKNVLREIEDLRDKNRSEGKYSVSSTDTLRDLENEWLETMPSVVDLGEVTPLDDRKEEENEYISRFISDKLDAIVHKGFKPVYSGREIVGAIHDKQELIFDSLVFDITETMLNSVMKEAREREKSRALVFDEFIFISISRINFEIAKKTFSHGFKDSENVHVSFREKSLVEEVNAILSNNPDTNGTDVLTQFFFESFMKSSSVRENINVPSPETILKVEV